LLSYQHDYHAGNHADVLKHAVLALLIRALQRKISPLRVIDTHAGSGLYDLSSPMAQHGREYERGVARVMAASDPPATVAPYLEVLEQLNHGDLNRYPGSPAFALSLLREQDHLELFELHPQALEALRQWAGREPRVHIHRRDGFEGLPAIVPPPEKRGIVLIDPAYEQKTDYDRVADVLATSCRRWPNGVFVIWYPLLRQQGSAHLIRKIQRLGLPKVFQVELTVAPEGEGLRGSGLIIVNLPYQVDEALGQLLPWLTSRLSTGGDGTWTSEWLG
jgi:23S rRNA (adenine2030-N6)-methyltransferase